MRLRRFLAAVFGPHRDRDLDLDSDVVVVFGRNESGKSSFRAAIETLLYGFEPATREKHPLALWGGERGGDLHLEASLALDDGDVLAVERVLQATGKSRTARNGADFPRARSGNTPLSIVDGLPRKVFRSIYSVEIEQLTALEESEQAHVDDLLLPTQESLHLHPTKQVRAELLREHQGLWRENRVGRPRARALMDELSAARDRVREADAEEKALREARTELRDTKGRLDEAGERKRQLERVIREAPLLRDWYDLQQRERRLGPAVDLNPLSGQALRDPAEIQDEIEALERSLAAPRARLAETPTELSEQDRTILEAAAEIQGAVNGAARGAPNRGLGRDADTQAQSLVRESERALAGLLAEAAPSEDVDWVDALPIEQLRSAQSTWARAFEAPLAAESGGRTAPIWIVAVAILIATSSAGAAALLLEDPLTIGLAGLLGAAVAFGLYAVFNGLGSAASEPPPRPSEIDAILADRPFAPILMASPTELQRAIDVLADVQRDRNEAARLEDTAKSLAGDLADFESRGEALCRKLGVDSSGGADVWVERLRLSLDAANDAAKRAAEAATGRREAKTQIADRTPDLERLRAHLEVVERLLRDTEPDAGDLDEAFQRVVARRAEQEYLRTRRAELASDSEHAAFAEDSRTKREDPPESSESAAAELRTLDAAIAADRESVGKLTNRLSRDPGSRAARARDEVQALEEELTSVRRERDRLALLDSVLARAEHAFREAHQPDVLRRASDHLRRVTNHRYHALFYEEGAGLRVACGERDEPAEVKEPISRGTLDQIFLCLRLGLLDHLDADREKLPLILDDALVRMDDVRRGEIYALLADISTRRQVFLLTCHENIANEAMTALKAARIDLSND